MSKIQRYHKRNLPEKRKFEIFSSSYETFKIIHVYKKPYIFHSKKTTVLCPYILETIPLSKAVTLAAFSEKTFRIASQLTGSSSLFQQS